MLCLGTPGAQNSRKAAALALRAPGMGHSRLIMIAAALITGTTIMVDGGWTVQ